MNINHSRIWIALFAGILAFAGPASAADRDATLPDAVVPIPTELVDDAFRGSVDLEALRKAIRTLDCQSLLDQTARLAKAERKVGRPHRSVSSQALFSLLMRMISEKGDAEALQAVESRLDELGQKDAKELVQQARQLLAEPRRVDLGPGVQREDVSAEAITLFGTLKEQIRVARVVGDAEVLQTLKDAAGRSQTLHPKQRTYLTRIADTSIASLEPKTDGTLLALSTLAGFSIRSVEKKTP